jgi:hypothetical protein
VIRAACTLVVTVTLVALAAGCGSDTIDADQVEQDIEQDLSTATARIESISCPDDVEKEKGATFQCDARLSGGGKAKVDVKQTTAAGGYEPSFTPNSVQIADNSLEPVLEEELADTGLEGAKVDCPDLVKVQTGKTFSCSVVTPRGAQGSLTFTFSDDSGTVDSSSVESET